MSILLPVFYTLVLLLPIQIGKHFFFNFSQIAGLRSDYLAPTIFATDVIIAVFIVLWAYQFFRMIVENPNYKTQLTKRLHTVTIAQLAIFFLLLISLFTSIFIAFNPLASFYKWLKIVEFLILGFIIMKLKLRPLSFIFVLSISALYVCLIALGQFLLQHSLGGVFWWLGERTFSINTAGIAKITIGAETLLRPYSIFPHPNVLGGFLAVVIPLIVFALRVHDHRFQVRFKLWFRLVLTIALLTLIFSFSKAAWIVTLIGIVFAFWCSKGKKYTLIRLYQNHYFVLFLLVFCISILTPFLIDKTMYAQFDNIRERADAIQAAFYMFSISPIFGVGLNNFVIHLHNFVPKIAGLYIFQPVHNIYLLTLVEMGIIGFVLVMYLLGIVIKKSLSVSPFIYIGFIQLLLLGLFDHYLFTLQQGQILFTLFAAFSISTMLGKETT